jgi:hypothetical protein
MTRRQPTERHGGNARTDGEVSMATKKPLPSPNWRADHTQSTTFAVADFDIDGLTAGARRAFVGRHFVEACQRRT